MTDYLVTITWDSGASVRSVPNTSNTSIATLADNAQVHAWELVPDSLDPTNTQKLWAHISGGAYDGKYVAVLYPSSSGDYVRATWEDVSAPPPDPTPTPTFPESFILVDPQGKKAEYAFVRIVE